MENREKRKNFSPFEKEVLLELVVKYQSIVENKLTSAAVNKEKAEAWDKIAKEFNGTPGTTNRSARQLLDCHRNFKRAQKVMGEEKMVHLKTGGGPVVSTISPFEEKVIALGMTKQMLINAVDGDVPVNVRNPGETAVPTDDLLFVETIVPTDNLHSLVERKESQEVKKEVVEDIPLACNINSPPSPPCARVTESIPKTGPSRNVQDPQPRQWRPHQKKRRICANASWEKALEERRKDEMKESELRMHLLGEKHKEEQRRLEEKHREEQRHLEEKHREEQQRSEEKHREEQRRLEEIHQIELQLRENKKWLLDLQIAEFEKTGK